MAYNNSVIIIRIFQPSDLAYNFHRKYQRQRTGSALVEVMACSLFSTQPLYEPMLTYCHLDSSNKDQWNSNQNISFMKMHLKMLSAKWRLFCPGGDWLSTHRINYFLVDIYKSPESSNFVFSDQRLRTDLKSVEMYKTEFINYRNEVKLVGLVNPQKKWPSGIFLKPVV